MRISEKERLTELYHCLKAVPQELWRSEDYSVIKAALQENNLSNQQSISFHIIGRLAHMAGDPEQFVQMVKQNKLETLELNEEESEILKGGLKRTAAKISKGEIGKASDSLKIFKAYYAKAS